MRSVPLLFTSGCVHPTSILISLSASSKSACLIYPVFACSHLPRLERFMLIPSTLHIHSQSSFCYFAEDFGGKNIRGNERYTCLITFACSFKIFACNTSNFCSRRGSVERRMHHSILLPLSAVSLWLTFPLVTLSSKCLLTNEIQEQFQCTRFGGTGAGFAHPVTVAALHLLLVGTTLFAGSFVSTSCYSHYKKQKKAAWQLNSISRSNRLIIMEQSEDMSVLSVTDRLRTCGPVGLAFGLKYVVGHWALNVTPAVVYELFHGLNLLFVATLAYFVLNERLQSRGEVFSCFGVVVGSMLAGQQGFQVNGKINLLVLFLNLLNGMLAGVVVVLLRSTMFKLGNVAQVTAYKMLLGAAAVLPAALCLEGVSPVLSMTTKQFTWLLISSGAILVYHVTLGLLCWLATTAHTVAVVEALRPVSAFLVLAGLQKWQPKRTNFWIGSVVVLVSAVGFHLAKRFNAMYYNVNDNVESETTHAPTLKSKQGETHHRLRTSSESTETTSLLSNGTAEVDVLLVSV